MSCLFYMWWDWRFIFLLLATGSIDYFAGKLILGKPQKAKLWLSISISANLLCLGFFKYGQWIFISLQTFLVHEFSIHLPENISHYSIVLPLGISFKLLLGDSFKKWYWRIIWR
ncbi:MAG: hypothetical protein NTX03_06155 [Bacteroidetes bacterium]|nr:hypothetical protein [Bacteroidota bacterium]